MRGGKALARLDLIVAEAAAHGIKVEGTIATTPHWASPGGAWNDAPAEAERSHREIERPRQTEDVACDLASFDEDHGHPAAGDDSCFRIAEPCLAQDARRGQRQQRQEPEPAREGPLHRQEQ